MKPTIIQRSLSQSEVTESGEFVISSQDAPHIMRILRDTLYSDKILAVLREYSSNAWDAHAMAGKKDIPIKVTLPTRLDPTLSIRDYGFGLSRQDVLRVYTRYGASTKRDSDDAVGMLGIGSKSGFAYADSFVIVSYYEGVKSMYVAVLDASDKGVINLMHEEPCGPDETGVMIQIAVEQKDISEFVQKAKIFFTHFQPRPETNIDIPALPTALNTLKNGVIYERNKDRYDYYAAPKWVAIMGCVSYVIDRNQFNNNKLIPAYIWNLNGAVYVDIGQVNVSASREALKYTDLTKDSITKKLLALSKEYVDTIVTDVDNKKMSLWEKRLALQPFHYLQYSLPAQFQKYAESYVRLTSIPKTVFTIDGTRDYDQTFSLNVDKHVRLVVHDEKKRKSIKGYDLSSHDILCKRVGDTPWTIVMAELQKFIDANQLTGIPVVKTSELTWVDYSTKKVGNIKHRLKKFEYDAKLAFDAPYSNHWSPSDKIDDASDVYVEMENFVPTCAGTNIHEMYEYDSYLCGLLGMSMPKIYSYKVTEKNPSKVRTGIPYKTWRSDLRKKALTNSKILEFFENYSWNEIDSGAYNLYYDRNIPESIAKLKHGIGNDHIICKFLDKKYEACNNKPICDRKFTNNITQLCKNIGVENSQAKKEYENIVAKYPLFGIRNINISAAIDNNHMNKWIDYIKMVERK